MKNIDELIVQANHQAIAAMVESQPVWTGCANAVDVIPG